MASRQLYGSAEIEYTPIDDYNPVVHPLAVPLMINPAWGFQSTRRKRRWEVWTADGSERETFVLGGLIHEISAIIRFEDQPEELRELLRAGLEDNVTLTYRPYGPYGVEFECLLVSAGDDGNPDTITLSPDRERFAFGEYEISVVLRRVDGGTFEALLT